MKALGYHPLFAVLHCLKYFVKGDTTGRIGALRMLNAYLYCKLQDFESESQPRYDGTYNSFYPVDFREYVKDTQLKRMLDKLNPVAKS